MATQLEKPFQITVNSLESAVLFYHIINHISGVLDGKYHQYDITQDTLKELAEKDRLTSMWEEIKSGLRANNILPNNNETGYRNAAIIN